VPTADLDGRKLSYVRRGTGPPLLLVQGMAAHHRLWGEQLLSALETDFDIVAFDHRGVGDSDEVAGDFTVVDLVDDAVALLDRLGWADAHILGFSLGGMVAQELVLRYPERVRTLILASTYAGGEGTDLSAPGAMTMLQAMQTGDVEVALRAAFAANLSATYVADESHYAPFKQVSLSVPVRVPTIIAQARAGFFHNARDRLPTITVATLILHGTDDQIISFPNGQQLHDLIPGSRLHTFGSVGHLFWWERPNETVALIREHCLASRLG
jgi:pimeloyl-ACP methyl ester carboxylesterase